MTFFKKQKEKDAPRDHWGQDAIPGTAFRLKRIGVDQFDLLEVIDPTEKVINTVRNLRAIPESKSAEMSFFHAFAKAGKIESILIEEDAATSKNNVF